MALQKKKDWRKIRPEVIIISKQGQGSSADILSKVKASPELTNLEDNVSRIRRPHKGNLMLKVKKPMDVPADILRILEL